MNERELKIFPECISKKLISLKQEGVSQDIEILPLLLFIKVVSRGYTPLERIIRVINEEAFPFKAEILDLLPDVVVLCFDIFRSFQNEIDNALILAQRLVRTDFVESVFVAKRRGVFRYITIKGREFVVVDTGVFAEFFKNISILPSGVYLDEEVFANLYHNVSTEVVDGRYLRVKKIRDDYIFHYIPEYTGQNPLLPILSGNSGIIILKGRDGMGKTRSALNAIHSHDFDMVAHVKLRPFMQFQPMSTLHSISRSLEFYVERENTVTPIEFLESIAQDTRKKLVFIENAEYIDPDSRERIKDIVENPLYKNIFFILEGSSGWDGVKEVVLDEYSESLGLKIFKSLLGYRKPDKSILDFVSRLAPKNYTNIVDIFSILSFKKYLIFGEDTVYLSPIATTQLGKIENKDSLYELFFNSLSPEEEEALLSLVLNYGVSDDVDTYFPAVLRLARHGIVRVGPRIEVVSSIIAKQYLDRIHKDKIRSFIETKGGRIESNLKIWHFEVIGEKRAAFRELVKFKDEIDKDSLSRKEILTYLLSLEPTEREKIDILMELKDIEVSSGNIQRSQEYLKKAISVAKQLEDEELLARVLYIAGVFNARHNQMGSALMYLKDALRLLDRASLVAIRASVLLEIASIYMKKKDAHKLVEILDLVNSDRLDNIKRAKYLFLRAVGHIMQGKTNKAHGLLEEAFMLAKDAGDKLLLSEIMTKMAEVELTFGQSGVARKYAEDAIKFNEENKEARLLLAKAGFREGSVVEALDILKELVQENSEVSSVAAMDLSLVLAYLGRYREAIEHINRLIEDKGRKSNDNERRALVNKARYLLRLGQYKKAWDITSALNDPELKDEFYLFLMGENYSPVLDTPYIKIVTSFTTLKEVKSLDSTSLNDYDYIDAGWMIMYNRSLKELLNGNYERAYDSLRNINNGYFRASLLVNLAKYIINRGGDGDPFLKEAGDIADAEGYIEVLFWIYLILGKKDKAFRLFDHMFEDNVELRDNYISARAKVLGKL